MRSTARLVLCWLLVCVMIITPSRVLCEWQKHMMTDDASSFNPIGDGVFGPSGYTFTAVQCVFLNSPADIPGLPMTIYFTLTDTTVPTSPPGDFMFLAMADDDVTITVGMRLPDGNVYVTVKAGDQPFQAISDWTVPTDSTPVKITIKLTSSGGSLSNDRGAETTFTFVPPSFQAFQTTALAVGDIMSVGLSSTIRDINIASNSASGSGDPQFFGFHGQSFQVHGFPDAIMNLITMKEFQWNSMFVYLDGTNRVMTNKRYNHTQRYSHPGTYLGELYFNTPTGNIHIRAGSYEQGLTVLNNSRVVSYEGHVTTHDLSNMTLWMISKHRVVVKSRYLSITVDNSDWFVNIDVHQYNLKQSHACETFITRKTPTLSSTDPYHTKCTLHDMRTGEVVPMHGLIGGTYRNIRYAHNRLYEGEPDDYRVSTPSGSDFTFNLYHGDATSDHDIMGRR